MTRDEFVREAIEEGWKPWGKLRSYRSDNKSQYQCFRNGTKYIWIGHRYVEHIDIPHAADFVADEKEAKSFLQELI